MRRVVDRPNGESGAEGMDREDARVLVMPQGVRPRVLEHIDRLAVPIGTSGTQTVKDQENGAIWHTRAGMVIDRVRLRP